MIELRTVDFVLLVVSSFVAGGLFGWGVNVAAEQFTDWLDTWGICP